MHHSIYISIFIDGTSPEIFHQFL